MEKTTTKCPKCGGEMSEGIVIDRGHMNTLSASAWYPGEPDKSIWALGLKIDPKKQRQITTYRCDQCGYLESFAY
jgi:predicted RNA-binding Zn-ribbon protein involved in translation (DUF1610 family)